MIGTDRASHGAAALAAARTLHARLTAAKRRRRQFVVVLGVAGVIAGGSGVVATGSGVLWSEPAEAHGPVAAEEWAVRAEVALVSVRRQLDEIAMAEARWASAGQRPPSPRTGDPGPIAALLARKTLLEQQRAALEGNLGAVRAVPRVRQDLASIEEQLRRADTALADVGGLGLPGDEQRRTVDALRVQRDLLTGRRDSRRAELNRLVEGSRAATTAALPDLDRATLTTAAVVAAVTKLIEKPGAPPDPPAPRHNLPPATAPRPAEPRERGEVGHGAPPRAGTPDSTGGRRAAPGRVAPAGGGGRRDAHTASGTPTERGRAEPRRATRRAAATRQAADVPARRRPAPAAVRARAREPVPSPGTPRRRAMRELAAHGMRIADTVLAGRPTQRTRASILVGSVTTDRAARR